LVPTAVVIAGVLGAVACSKGTPAPAGGVKKPPVPVLVAVTAQADVPVELRALGTVEATQSTPVRAQIGGTIMEVRFREGEAVRSGQVLFQIDPRPYEATLRQLHADLARQEAQARLADAQVRNAEAQVRNAEAQLRNAETQVKRYEELVQKDFVTKEQYDQRRTDADAARAAVDASRATLDANRAAAQAAKEAAQSNRASIENARLQLGYATIRSPVSGQTGSLLAKQGDLIKANDTQLVVVNQLQPILVRFTVPEASLPEVQKYRQRGTLQVRVTPPGAPQPRLGRLAFVDNAVDPTTATIALKAQFDNTDHALWPGQFLDVTLVLQTLKNVVVVPSQAIQTGQQGPYVFVVDAGGAANVRPVEPGAAAGERTVVQKGLAAGETVVVDGQLRLTPGARVSVKEGLGGTGGVKLAGPDRGAPAPADRTVAANPPMRPVARGKVP
jgi:multidrug efflux system membrane fusion protein